ncbi:MAG: glucose-6-phosphate isomerase family protein [Nanoarchaeota archaeon]|nr:glucose-6-phosphate isomerase family protein [Nanoarchaeota archaeon]
MIDLKNSGLDLAFDEKNLKLISKSKTLKLPKPGIRTLKQAKKFLMDEKSTAENNDQNIYYMYRDVCANGDKEKLAKYNLRYDITVIPPNKIGREFIKTVGHYHPFLKNEKVTYPEVYEVLHGTAHYLLQKIDMKGKVIDVKVIIANKNDKVLIPPNYGHVTINAGKEPLIMTNLVELNFSSEYGDYKKKHGAIYYGLDVDGQIKFVENPKYKEHPKLKVIKVREMSSFGLLKEMPLYVSAIKFPDKFEYLTKPQFCFKE